MKHLIIGCGEAGLALCEVLGDAEMHDPPKGFLASIETCEFLHIAIPYSQNFYQFVKDYQRFFSPMLTVIHSTVPVGTSDSLNAVHSPIRGKHPNLAQSIRTFTKYFGGAGADVAAQAFTEKGVPVCVVNHARDCEALKLWDTAQYGLMILLQKEIYRWCEENNCDFNIVYKLANGSYNAGFAAMALDFSRPTLEHMNGPIGGHCVAANAELLDSWIAGVIVAQNNLLKQKESECA